MIAKKTQIELMPEWLAFIKKYQLSEQQAAQFMQYLLLLQEYNELFNLTTIIESANIIAYHFCDSLAVSNYVDFTRITMLADVGSGAGFPGIPLKILFPSIEVKLIEVTFKKIEFLNTVITALGLQAIEVVRLDWRTFLRKTHDPIDIFVSRASLHTPELMRMFKPNCPYKDRTLTYWASKDWQLSSEDSPFFLKEELYKIKHKHRRLIFFQAPTMDKQ